MGRKAQRGSKLTDKQRRFAEALAKDPERNQTRAAIAAGYRERCAKVTASRLLTRANVQAYLAELTAQATALANRRTRGTIATMAEALEYHTRVMREARLGRFIDDEGLPNIAKIQKAGPGVVKKVSIRTTTMESGQVQTSGEVQVGDGQRAADAIIAHYEAAKDRRTQQGLTDALRDAPANLIAELGRFVLARGAARPQLEPGE